MVEHQLTIVQRLQQINLYEPACLPDEFWWGIWNLTPRVQGRCPATPREIKHLTTNQCLEGAGIQCFPPDLNVDVAMLSAPILCTWYVSWGWVDYCKQLERFKGWSWHSHIFRWDGIDTLGLMRFQNWVTLLLILQNSMGSTPIAILPLPDRIQADKANSTWPVRICTLWWTNIAIEHGHL